MSEGLVVREALPSDAPDIARLTGQLGYLADVETIGQRLARILEKPDHAVLVAESSPGRVVGWLHVAAEELLESGRRCAIHGLVVDAEHRRRGVGRLLVGAAESWAGAREVEVIAVRSNVIRPESHPFYERLGYARAKTQHAYRKTLGDAE